MIKRIVSAVFLVPIVFFYIYIGGIYLKVATGIVAIMTIYEFYKSTNCLNIYLSVGGILTTLYVYIFGFEYFEIFLIVSLFALLIVSLFSKKFDVYKIGIYQISIFYIILPLYLINIIRASNYSIFIWLVVLIPAISDTSAYFIGKKHGKHKLAPEISPKKTKEGSIGGFVASVIATIAFYYIFGISGYVNVFVYIVFISIATIVSQLGDLVASKIKRTFSIKDFGKIMPGHGGILDRFDSALILIPIIYIFIKIISF